MHQKMHVQMIGAAANVNRPPQVQAIMVPTTIIMAADPGISQGDMIRQSKPDPRRVRITCNRA